MRRLAIVEDNPDNRLLLRAMLADQYELVEYEDGLVALEGIRASPPELLLLDISLPGLDGRELLRRLRAGEDPVHAPAIALTAHALDDERRSIEEAGFEGYVSKPILDEQVLLDELERLLP